MKGDKTLEKARKEIRREVREYTVDYKKLYLVHPYQEEKIKILKKYVQ
jgi:hypothetical protein